MIIYLYVKQHQITGLMYFGMTRKLDPFKYLGSGKYWLRQVAKPGAQVHTTHIWGFDNQYDATEFALKFSDSNKISVSEEWANLRYENAKDGNSPGFVISEETRTKLRTRTGEANHFFGKQHTEETKAHLSSVRKGRPGQPHSPATKTKIGENSRQHMLGRKLSEATKAKMRASHAKRKQSL